MATIEGVLALRADTAQVVKATTDLRKFYRQTINAEQGAKKLASNVVDATKKFRPMKGAMQQASFQLQDVAVQAQSGTDAFIILGQQGPQIASIFGPGGAVVGAMIAFGALVGGVATKMLVTKKSAEELGKEIQDLGVEFGQLTAAQQAFIQEQRLDRIADMEGELRVLENALIKAKDAATPAAVGMNAMAGAINRVSTEDPKQLAADIDLLKASLEAEKRALDGRSESADEMIADLEKQLELVGLNAKAEALYTAELNGATGEQQRQIATLYDLIASRERAIEVEENYQNMRARVADEADRQYEREREAAVRAGQAAADARQREIDADMAETARKKASAEEHLANVLLMNETELEAFERQLQEKRDRLAEDRAHGRITEQQHQQALTEITEAEATKRADIEKRLAEENTERLLEFSDMLLKGKSEKAQEAAKLAIGLADAEKRENAKQIISDSYAAAMKAYKAMSDIPVIGPALGAAAAGAIIAAGVSFSAKSLTGRALGGQVRPGESYMVGERGPEILTMGNAGGRIATNESMRSGGGSLVYSPTVNITGGATEQDRAIFTAQLRQQKAEIADLLARRRF